MELIQVGERTYYIPNATNIGVYLINDREVYLIDTGNDKDTGKKILKLIEEKNWEIKGIINTHSHADHIGGNHVIAERTSCSIYCHGIENYFINTPSLEPTFLYGSNPLPSLHTKFLEAKPSMAKEISDELPEGLSYFELKGHTFDLIGIKTTDDVYFLGDAVINEETINKYSVFFLENVQAYLDSLDYLSSLEGKWFVPSHGKIGKDISKLIELNRSKIFEIADFIVTCCTEAKSFEAILKEVFTHYNLVMNVTQYYLIGSTLKAYLTYLVEKDQLLYFFEDNIMYYRKKEA